MLMMLILFAVYRCGTAREMRGNDPFPKTSEAFAFGPAVADRTYNALISDRTHGERTICDHRRTVTT